MIKNKYFILISILTILVVIKLYAYNNYYIEFFQNGSDYPPHSLGHGININFWLHGESLERKVGYYQTIHPGILFQLVSGIIYELSAFSLEGNRFEKAVSTITNPKIFWMLNQMFALLIFIISIALLYSIGTKINIRTGVLLILIYLSYPQIWEFGMRYLGNETFAMLLFIALITVLNRAIHSAQLINWFYVGSVAGICYLNKLNYITWGISVFLTIVALFYIDKKEFKYKINTLAVYISGIGFSVLTIGGLFLGYSGLLAMFNIHSSVILKTGYYGGGETGVSPEMAMAAINSLIHHYPYFCVELIAVLLIVLYIFFSKYKEFEATDKYKIPYFIFLITAFSLAFVAVLKHPGLHYLIVSFITLPFLALFSFNYLPKRTQSLLIILCLIPALFNTANYIRHSVIDYKTANEYKAEVEYVRSLSVSPDEYRIWTYRVGSTEYLSYFAMGCSEIFELRKYIKMKFPGDFGDFFTGIPDDMKWKYMIFSKDCYPSFKRIPEDVQKISEVVFDGKHLFAVQRII